MLNEKSSTNTSSDYLFVQIEWASWVSTKVSAKTRRAQTAAKRVSKRAQRERVDHGPLYLQIARALKDDIVRGAYPVGARLPTEAELSVRFGASRHSVREALRRLRDDQLVASRQGAGTVVVSTPTSDAYAQDIMSINDLVAWSADRRFAIESMEMGPLDAGHAGHAGVVSEVPWLIVRGFGHEPGPSVPVCWAEYAIHPDYAAVGRLLPRHTGPVFPLLEDLFGIRVVEVHQTIGATLITSTLGSALAVDVGSAALEVRRSYRASDGQIAQVTVSVHPATRYQHSMTLRRVKGKAPGAADIRG